MARKYVHLHLNVPVSVMPTAGEGGAWGIAVLASYMVCKEKNESLTDYLHLKVFKDVEALKIDPHISVVNGFNRCMERYSKGITIEQAAVDHFTEKR